MGANMGISMNHVAKTSSPFKMSNSKHPLVQPVQFNEVNLQLVAPVESRTLVEISRLDYHSYTVLKRLERLDSGVKGQLWVDVWYLALVGRDYTLKVLHSPAFDNTRGRSTNTSRVLGNYRPTRILERYNGKFPEFLYPSRGTPEAHIRIAYLFLIHDPIALLGMQESLDVLYETKHLFVIHIDGDAHPTFTRFVISYYENVPNIHVLAGVSIQWGTASVMLAEKMLYEYAVRVGGWDLAISLCGNSFPVKSPFQIARFVRMHKGITFSNSRKIDGFDKNGK
eukprot:CFRG6031T1